MAGQSWLEGYFEHKTWLGLGGVTDAALAAKFVVTQDPVTGAFKVNNIPVSGATSCTLAQFLVLDVADCANYTILISDIPTPHSRFNGVLVRANAAGTGWIWIETPSLTLEQIASNGITAAIAWGWRIFASNLGPGCYIYSDGTRFKISQPSVVLNNIDTNIVLTGTPTSATVAKQVEIPRIDGKSIWGDGDILRIEQSVEKTGVADIMHTAVYMGQTARALNDADTNTLISTLSGNAIASDGVSFTRRILRKSDKLVRNLGPELAHVGGVSNVPSVDVAIPSLDDATSYVDATIRIATSTGDTALTLNAHTVTLIQAGVAK